MAWKESKSSTGQAASLGSDTRLPCAAACRLMSAPCAVAPMQGSKNKKAYVRDAYVGQSGDSRTQSPQKLEAETRDTWVFYVIARRVLSWKLRVTLGSPILSRSTFPCTVVGSVLPLLVHRTDIEFFFER